MSVGLRNRLLAGSGSLALQYVAAQGLNLLAQTLLFHALGPEIMGRVGLALVGVNAALFLGDLGFSQYFLRQIRQGADWRGEWAAAQGYRATFLAAGSLGLLLVWAVIWGLGSPGGQFLCGALPAVALSFFNFSSVLIARDRAHLAGAGPVLANSLYVLGTFLTLKHVDPAHAPLWLGASLTAGHAAQAAYHLLATRGERLAALGTAGRHPRVLRRSLRLWSLALVGTLYQSATPFLVGWAAPALLAYYLLTAQVLQGLSGVLGQVYRLTTPLLCDLELSPVPGAPGANPLARTLVGAMTGVGSGLGLLAGALAVGAVAIMPWSGWRAASPMLLLVLLTWLMTNYGAALVPSILARREEGFLLASMLILHPVSLAAQVGAAALGSVAGILLVTAIAAAAIAVLCLRRLGLDPASFLIFLAFAAPLLAAPALFAIPPIIGSGPTAALALFLILGGMMRFFRGFARREAVPCAE